MSDVKQDQPMVDQTVNDVKAVDIQEPVQPDNQPKVEDQNIDQNNEDLNSLKKDFEDMKKSFSTWQEKEKVYKNQIKGLDRKVSELTQAKKQLEQKEMSQEEILEEKNKELNDKYQSLWRDLAVVQDFHYMEDDDRNIIKTYLYGNSEDDMKDSAKSLYDIIDKYIKAGVEKGVNERLMQGYKPKSAGQQGDKVKDITEMSREELIEKAKQVAAMPSGEEKDRLLKKLVEEENRRRLQ